MLKTSQLNMGAAWYTYVQSKHTIKPVGDLPPCSCVVLRAFSSFSQFSFSFSNPSNVCCCSSSNSSEGGASTAHPHVVKLATEPLYSYSLFISACRHLGGGATPFFPSLIGYDDSYTSSSPSFLSFSFYGPSSPFLLLRGHPKSLSLFLFWPMCELPLLPLFFLPLPHLFLLVPLSFF